MLHIDKHKVITTFIHVGNNKRMLERTSFVMATGKSLDLQLDKPKDFLYFLIPSRFYEPKDFSLWEEIC